MQKIPESLTTEKLLERTSLRIYQAVYRVNVGLTLTEGKSLIEEDLASLGVQEILEKIEEFINSEPDDEQYIVFMHYLAKYPVSMCKRNVSRLLRFLIGFHYRYGQLLKEKHFKTVKPVSMEELAQIFGRSKATIHECIKDTEEQWKEFLELKKREEEIEAEAERELIEEAKERLRQEKQVLNKECKQNERTNERTSTHTEGEGIVHSF